MSATFWIVTHDAGYPERWLCTRLADGTIFPLRGPFRSATKEQP